MVNPGVRGVVEVDVDEEVEDDEGEDEDEDEEEEDVPVEVEEDEDVLDVEGFTVVGEAGLLVGLRLAIDHERGQWSEIKRM